MFAWINFTVLLVAGISMSILYVASVQPAHMEQRIGSRAYRRAGVLRSIASLLMVVLCANYILYHWYLLPIDPLPRRFPWPYGLSVGLAVLLAIPSLYLMLRGVIDAGTETLLPDKSHTLYGGIYHRVRHPQAVGEFLLWFVMGFLINSPLMTLISLGWLPVWIWFCAAEEKDLLLRYGDDYRDYMQRTGRFFPRRPA